MNNPTLYEFCFLRIGRADIEESKSCVAMIARQLQASYPCGNFSVTHLPIALEHGISRPKFPPIKLHKVQYQARFCPYTQRVVSFPAVLTLGRLCYLLTVVPPQPNSPHKSLSSNFIISNGLAVLPTIIINLKKIHHYRHSYKSYNSYKFRNFPHLASLILVKSKIC